MFWPFKRTRVISFEEAIADKPMPECGDKSGHYFWEDFNGLPCPKCRAASEQRKLAFEREALADLIADKVLKRLDIVVSRGGEGGGNG